MKTDDDIEDAKTCSAKTSIELCPRGGPSAGRRQLRRACVNDRYARRIDRFFNWNPALANSYVRHEHFEVRAIAAKHADVFFLKPLLQ